MISVQKSSNCNNLPHLFKQQDVGLNVKFSLQNSFFFLSAVHNIASIHDTYTVPIYLNIYIYIYIPMPDRQLFLSRFDMSTERSVLVYHHSAVVRMTIISADMKSATKQSVDV